MNQRRGQGQELTQNQQITEQQRAQQALNQLMRDVRAKRSDIEAVLPADIKFEKFQACLNMAIRREPKLLECHGPTLIRATIMCAYDGLLPDGKQAVIVWRAMSYKLENGQWAKNKRLEASYMPMAFGLRMKIVGAGAAKHIKATCVYQNDFFEWEEGLKERLDHTPFLADAPQAGANKQEEDGAPDPRGPLRAVYSIAVLPDGERVFEVMPRREVMKVREKAQTKDVWDGPFEAEMWRKTILRRHSKALPTAVPIRDAEADLMFPQFAAGGAPALEHKPAAPTRGDFAQLGAPEVDLPLDLSGFGDDRGELIDQPREEKAAAKKPAAKGQAKPEPAVDPGTGEVEREQQDQRDPPAEAPTDWPTWEKQLLLQIGQTTKVEDLDDLHRREQANIGRAPKGHKGVIENSFLDKRVDLQENQQ